MMNHASQLDQLQKKAQARYRVMFILTALLFVVLAVLLGRYGFGTDANPLFKRIAAAVCVSGAIALAFCGIFYLLLVKKSYDAFNLYFKQHYVLPLIEQSGYFENLSYSPHNGFSYDEIRDSAVVATGDPKYFHSEDFLSGSYQGIGFLYGDVETKHIVRSGKKREVRTIFEGQIMRFSSFDDNKRSFGHLQIFENAFLSNLKGWTAQNKIQTEDEVFNNRFQIYSADSLNAFYILTPRMMEQITKFADEIGEQICITFTGSMMYVAIHRTRSMFDAYVDQPIQQQQEDIEQDVKMLCRAGDLLITELNRTT